MDDYRDARELYRHYLTLEAYGVAEASDGREANETACRVCPVVVLMDLSPPLMDGLEATRRLRGDPKTARIPVLALTAHVSPLERARALACGCDAYLTKPCLPEALALAIAEVLGATKAARARTTP